MNHSYPINLGELFSDIPVHVATPIPNPETIITGVVMDSRLVQPGNVFVAVIGHSTDGHRYIPQALQNGAAAVVGTQDFFGLSVPYLRVDDSRQALAHLSAAFYGFPARHLRVIGITGTDGKTTTCNLLYAILRQADIPTGMISTISAMIGDQALDTGFHVTTPEAPDVQRYLASMVSAGMTHVILESTSHGLEQHRVDACEFDIAVVTNITHEHLDNHGSYAAYRAAKARLLIELEATHSKPWGNPRLAVLNRDDSSYEFLSTVVKTPSVSYSLQSGKGIWAEDIRMDKNRMQFTAVSTDWRVRVECHLVGEYNVSNCLAAMGAAVFGLGIPPLTAARGITTVLDVPGRMEPIEMGQNFTAIVDFAHTPNALENFLKTARRFTQGRVIVVFGSAGLRDRDKRRKMAEVSTRLADYTIFTAEDPRTESLDDILEEMTSEAKQRGGVKDVTYWRVRDRGEAIRKAISLAQAGDIVAACGKGHEQSMCFETIEYAWDDRTAMRSALADFLHIRGPNMPYLPTQK